MTEPDPDRGNVDGALVHELALVIAGGDGPELLELGVAALDGVAFAVAFPVEGGRAAARAAAALGLAVMTAASTSPMIPMTTSTSSKVKPADGLARRLTGMRDR